MKQAGLFSSCLPLIQSLLLFINATPMRLRHEHQLRLRVSFGYTNFQLFKLCTQLGGHTHNKSAVCRLRLTANRLSIPVAKRYVRKEQVKSHTRTPVGPKHEGVIKIEQCNMQTIFKENLSYLFLVLELLTGRFLAMLAGFCYIHPWSRQRITPEENHRKKEKKKLKVILMATVCR